MVKGPSTPVAARVLARQRHEVIVAEVRRRGAVRVSELATLLAVSDMTVRRDLDLLDEAGLLLKVHGGATLRDERTTDEPGFEAKSLRNMGEKHAIAMAGAAMVRPGGAIGITAGTTTWQLAYHIVDIADLTVVTNSVRVAEVLASVAASRSHRRADGRHPHAIRRARRPSSHRHAPLVPSRLGVHGRARHHRTRRVQHAQPDGSRNESRLRRRHRSVDRDGRPHEVERDRAQQHRPARRRPRR